MSLKRKFNKLIKIGPAESGRLIAKRLKKRLHFVPKVPPIIFIEATNRCNLNCIMCDRSSMKRKGDFMDMNLFKRIIDNAACIGVPDVKLNRFGEPLMHQDLLEMVLYAKSKKFAKVFFTSNALLMDEEKARAFIESGLDAITFSIDGASKQVYEGIRLGSDYEKVERNVVRFHEIRNQLGCRKPVTSLNTMLMRETKSEIFDVLRKWEPVFDIVNLIPVGTYGNLDSHSTVSVEKPEFETIPCHHIFDRLMIFTNGDATVCCGDINGALCVGNLGDQTIEELWKGQKYKSIREIHIAGDFEKVPVCIGCDGINRDKLKAMQQEVRNVLAGWERPSPEDQAGEFSRRLKKALMIDIYREPR